MKLAFAGTPEFCRRPSWTRSSSPDTRSAPCSPGPTRVPDGADGLRQSAVKQRAAGAGIEVHQPVSLRGACDSGNTGRARSRRAGRGGPTDCSCLRRCSPCRERAASTSMRRSCRAGGVRRRRLTPFWPATGRPESRFMQMDAGPRHRSGPLHPSLRHLRRRHGGVAGHPSSPRSARPLSSRRWDALARGAASPTPQDERQCGRLPRSSRRHRPPSTGPRTRGRD